MAYRIHKAKLDERTRIKLRQLLAISESRDKYLKLGIGGRSVDFYVIDQEDVLIPMHIAGEFFKKPIINSERSYPAIKPFHLKLKLRDYQQEVVEYALKRFSECGTAFLNVFCSYGKTVVAAYFSVVFSHHQGLLTLVTYPRRIIGNSWIGTFQNDTTAKVHVIGENSEQIPDDVQVILCMDTRLKNVPPEIRARVGHLVLDEADCFCTQGHIEGVLAYEPKYITALTATYERDDGLHAMLDMLVGPERIIRISKKPFFVFYLMTNFIPKGVKGAKGTIFDSLVKSLDIISERNALIVQLVMNNLDQKILILTKHIEHATNLWNWLRFYVRGYEKTVSLLAGDVSGYDDADILVATYSKAGRGFDEKSGCRNWGGRRIELGILAASTKKIEQPAGRFLRAEIPVIIDIVDNHYNIKNHWRIRKKWYESRNGQVARLPENFVWSQEKERLLEAYYACPICASS